MPRRLHEAIALDLETFLQRQPLTPLPSIVELAEQWQVSYPTMWKAVHLLVAKGLISACRGRKIRRLSVKEGTLKSPSVDDASRRLYEEIRSAVSDGTYQVGRPFPKTGYFIASANATWLTVSRAFIRLADENLAHKRGRRWFVGPAPVPHPTPQTRRLASHRPVVLMLLSPVPDWESFFQHPFTNAFIVPFRNEIASYGVQIEPVLTTQTRDESRSFPVGIDEARSMIRSLGDRYMGTIVPCAHPQGAQLDSWVPFLCSLRRPVVYFDISELGGRLQRKGLKDGRYFYRLHLDDHAAARMAVGELAGRGHKVIGVHGSELFDWTRQRTELVREFASKLSPPPKIVTAPPAESAWGFSQEFPHRINEFVSTIRQKTTRESSTPVGRQVLRSMTIDNSSSLVSMFREHSPTALISLRDNMAREHFFWLKELGVDMPRNLSMISFDNIPQSILFPISTIDFGFPRLGYLAAHILIGDITVSTDRGGNIPGVCTLMDRGSVAAPGDTRKLKRLLSPRKRSWN